MQCFECQMLHPRHKISCGSMSRMLTLEWLLASLQYLPDELLGEVHSKVQTEVLGRHYKEMFDEGVK